MPEKRLMELLLDQLENPAACVRDIRLAVKRLVAVQATRSIGRTMLAGQLIDSLFETYHHGLLNKGDLLQALDAHLNKYVFSSAPTVLHVGKVVALPQITRKLSARGTNMGYRHEPLW